MAPLSNSPTPAALSAFASSEQGEPITYLRNGEVFAKFQMALADGNNLAGVHANGDVLTVNVDGDLFNHTYAKPDGCTLPPAVTFELEGACQGVTNLIINNAGTSAATGYRLGLDGHLTEPIDSIAPGETTIPVQADKIQIVGPLGASSIAVLWLQLDVDWSEVKGCDPDTMSAAFEDTCDGVKVTVTSTFEVTQTYVVVKNPDAGPDGVLIAIGFVASGTPVVHNVPAVAGDEIAVYYPTGVETPVPEVVAKGMKARGMSAGEYPGVELIGAHIHAKPSCGGLPVTGFQVGMAAGLGLLLVVGGAVLYVTTRRRRFTAEP
ncbi:MAG TPA: hypothetical protein DGT23_03050 [Micromonosporaceae bacterium]|nr:hypothetical protein [Micromonosporaceae bacterium]